MNRSMEKKEITVKSFSELVDIFDDAQIIENKVGEKTFHSVLPFIYRGMSNVEWLLKPSIGRVKDYSVQTEWDMLSLFKRGARPYLDETPKNDWEWLSLAQHHGMPTRILDWTENPLVALFFAIETDYNVDSVVYALPAPEVIVTEKFHPLEYDKKAIVFLPELITPRIVAQQSQFTIHSRPDVEFTHWCKKIIIPIKLRNLIKFKLSVFGISRASLFPGLDGLAQSISWNKTADKMDIREYFLDK
jgi:hypothetical protein